MQHGKNRPTMPSDRYAMQARSFMQYMRATGALEGIIVPNRRLCTPRYTPGLDLLPTIANPIPVQC